MPRRCHQVIPAIGPCRSLGGRCPRLLLSFVLPLILLAGSVPAESVPADLVQLFHTAMAASVSHAAGARMRTWTDETGSYRVEAELVDYRDGKVHLKKTGGQTISLPLGKLSAADREFVQQQVVGESQPSAPTADAVVELLSGAKSQGRIVARDDNYITVEVDLGTRTLLRKYPLSRIRAVTIDGKREVLNETTGGGSPANPRPGPAADTGTTPAAEGRRTRAQIEALIDQVGRAQPDWWDSVPLNYPQSLDLSWPRKPPGGWDAQKNVGQYIWDVVNPNPGKWQEGVRFMHHLLVVHQDHPDNRLRAMNELGRMYYGLLQDYARAAFWWRKAGADRGKQFPVAGIHLAECYWKLGNKQMAVELLNQLPIYFPSIKLWADMGETRKALQLAEAGARGGVPDLAYLYAGDACRVAERYADALKYYQKVLDVPATGKAQPRIERNQQRARANIEGIRLFDALDLRRVPDGTYQADSPGYAGQLFVEVTVLSGHIESVKVVQHKEKQFYSAMTDTIRKIIKKQGMKGVDSTSGATITSEAIINATAKALAGRMK